MVYFSENSWENSVNSYGGTSLSFSLMFFFEVISSGLCPG